MLSVYNINVWYGAIHAIKNVSFEVNDGETVALIGANGAGKSTTLKTLSGLLRSRPAPSSSWARTSCICLPRRSCRTVSCTCPRGGASSSR